MQKVAYNVLLHVEEICCDNLKQDNKEREYYYYIINNPVKKSITKRKMEE